MGGTSMRHALLTVIALALVGCAGVRQEDTQSWIGRPVVDLEKHPVFATMQVVRTQTSDGTEIRNYVNGRAAMSCSGGGSAYRGIQSTANYNTFNNCIQQMAVCNNLFYITNGIITQFSPVGTGGARCYTNEKLRPDFSGPVDIQ
jgi:hypothetical protein